MSFCLLMRVVVRGVDGYYWLGFRLTVNFAGCAEKATRIELFSIPLHDVN